MQPLLIEVLTMYMYKHSHISKTWMILAAIALPLTAICRSFNRQNSYAILGTVDARMKAAISVMIYRKVNKPRGQQPIQEAMK